MQVEEYAHLKNIKIFRPGSHSSMQGTFSFSEDDLDAMVESSNACQDIIREAQQTGQYRGNDHLKLNKPIPAPLNLAHQKWLPESIKKLCKDVVAQFRREKDWIVADLLNVPNEIAQFIRDRFPSRSVELIPLLKHPDTGKEYRNIIRSIGFLPPDINPAVAGLPNDWSIEFQEGKETIMLYSRIEEMNYEEEKTMAKEEKEQVVQEEPKTPLVEPEKPSVDLAEFQSLKNQVHDLVTERERMIETIRQERKAREKQEIEMYCQNLQAQGYAPALFSEEFKMALQNVDNTQLIEFSGGKTISNRMFWQNYVKTILEMAEQNAVKVPLDEQTPDAQGKSKTLSKLAKQELKIREYQKQIQAERPGLDDATSYHDAYDIAVSKHSELFD